MKMYMCLRVFSCSWPRRPVLRTRCAQTLARGFCSIALLEASEQVPLQSMVQQASTNTVQERGATKPICLLNNGEQVSESHTSAFTGNFKKAKSRFQAALEQEEQRESGHAETKGCLMNLIGYVELQERHPTVAAEWFRRALKLSDLPSPLVARLTSNLASAYLDAGQLDHAEETARRALNVAVRAFGSEHPETLFPQATLAGVHFVRGDFARAEPVYRRVLHQAERMWGASAYEVSLAAGNLAMIYLAQNRYAQARVHFEKALSGLRNNLMRANDEIPLIQAGLALTYAAEGKAGEATLVLEQALASAEKELGSTDPSFAVILERGATAQYLLKDYALGRHLFERAITVLKTCYGPESQPVMEASQRYTKLFRAAGDESRAGLNDDRRRPLQSK